MEHALLVASAGGHLKQLHRLRPRLVGLPDRVRWVTFDTPQSRSLLAGEEVVYARYTGPRDPVAVLRNTDVAARVLRQRPVAVISTGSQLVLPFMGLARARQIPCHFIESAARSAGPSLTGRLLANVPGMRLYTQYRSSQSTRWRYGGSVLDGFASVDAEPVERLTRVVVVLGTMPGYGFRRLTERVLELVEPEADILWQTGATDVSGLPIKGNTAIPNLDLTQAMTEADVVIAHAGVGAALDALEAGRLPVLAPRRLHLGEHVDDHQIQVAAELAGRDLALVRDPDDLTRADLLAAASRRTVATTAGASFALR